MSGGDKRSRRFGERADLRGQLVELFGVSQLGHTGVAFGGDGREDSRYGSVDVFARFTNSSIRFGVLS